MCSKLITLFGIFWVLEAVHALLENWAPEEFSHNTKKECGTFGGVFFRFTSGCNLLRGLFFFLTFCCKRTIWQGFRKPNQLPKIPGVSADNNSGKSRCLSKSDGNYQPRTEILDRKDRRHKSLPTSSPIDFLLRPLTPDDSSSAANGEDTVSPNDTESWGRVRTLAKNYEVMNDEELFE